MTTATPPQNQNRFGLRMFRPSAKQSLFGSIAALILAVAIFLTWLFVWSGGDSQSSALGNWSGSSDGDSAPSIAPSPDGAANFFGSGSSLSVTVTDEEYRGEAGFDKVAAGAPAMETTGGVASVANTGDSRQVISQGFMHVEVVNVPTASARVRAIAEGVGGFVEQLNSYGVGAEQESTMTVRVPQEEFFSVFEQIKALGKVQSENAGTEDVTERFIDLEARLKSAQREELSLLSLLDRADQISEILIIEQELTRVRTELERLQGQLNFLERRVDLATISVSLTHPQRDDARAPSGSLSIKTSDVDASVVAVKALVSQVDGEIDQVFTSVQDGRERAVITLRVFPDDFNLVVATVEDQGGVVSKEIREGSKGDPVSDVVENEEPNARLDIVFGEKDASNLGRNLAIFIPVGVVSLLVVMGLFYGAYRLGLRRED